MPAATCNHIMQRRSSVVLIVFTKTEKTRRSPQPTNNASRKVEEVRGSTEFLTVLLTC